MNDLEFADVTRIRNEMIAELDETWRKLSIRSESKNNSEEDSKSISRLAYELGYLTTDARIRQPRKKNTFESEMAALSNLRSRINDYNIECDPFIRDIE